MQSMLYEYLDQKYKKLSSLGSAEKNNVWLAQDVETGHIVVKKYIPSENADVYECLKSIHHEALVPILYTAQGAQNAVVIMEYVSGQTVEERLETQGAFSESNAAAWMIQLLQGLRTVHEKGIIHRDINPHNLLISTDGVLKILDFDISRVYKEERGRDTRILGTAGYAAPEQFGFRQSDARTDIYAAGVLLNVMLTGKEPNEQLCTNEAVKTIIQTCIQIDPDRRYQSADELLRALMGISASRMIQQPGKILPKESGTPESPERPRQASETETIPVKTSIWPGFRTGFLWKKIIAGLYYVNMGIYSVGRIYQCRADPAAFLLEIVAVVIYIWLAAFLPLNFLGWMEKTPLVQRMGRIPRIILGIAIWMILFLGGFELDEYLTVNILHEVPLSNQ